MLAYVRMHETRLQAMHEWAGSTWYVMYGMVLYKQMHSAWTESKAKDRCKHRRRFVKFLSQCKYDHGILLWCPSVGGSSKREARRQTRSLRQQLSIPLYDVFCIGHS